MRKLNEVIGAWLCAVILLMTISHSAFLEAQEAVQRYRMERLEKETRIALEARREISQRFLYDYGGWNRIYYITYDDLGDDLIHKKMRTLRYNDLRIWATMNVDGVSSMYARARAEYLDWTHGSEYGRKDFILEQPRREDDFNFDPDQIFYSLQIIRALRRYAGMELPASFDLEFTGGRFFSELGNGLSYYGVGEGVELKGFSKHLNFKGFWFRTPRGETNIDFSVPGFRTEGQDREFFGAEISHPGFHRQRPYFYFLKQWDDTEEDPIDPFQDYRYDSYYLGLGASGEVVRNLTCDVEFVREAGKSFAQVIRPGDPQSREDISAWAFSGQLRKIFTFLTRPNVSLQYAFGTGDPDRGAGNVTNTSFGGNFPGTKDRNFLYFGYFDTGYNLAPRLANLEMLRFGLSLKPLDFIKKYKDSLEFGSNYYFFHKYKKEAGISDFRANRPLGNLGRELDFYLNAKVTSDLFFTINYGRFYPGNAYEDKNARDYILISTSIQF